MDDDAKHFFMMTVEIRILTAVMSRISHRAIEERFNAHKADISGLQYGILRTLGHESFTLSELSRRFMLDPSTLVPVIDALERKGMVARGHDPNDRRRIPISLTPDGANLLHSVPMYNEDDVLYKSLADMGEDKANELRDLLREVVKRMPEGEAMLESVTSRLYSLRGGVPFTESRDCVIHQGAASHDRENEQEQPTRRTTRRRVRRSHRERE
jgi:DNA-binding MarR family transcriptional regulator